MAKMAQNCHFFTMFGRFVGAKKFKQKTFQNILSSKFRWHKKPRNKSIILKKHHLGEKKLRNGAKIGPKMAKMAQNSHFFTMFGRFVGAKNLT